MSATPSTDPIWYQDTVRATSVNPAQVHEEFARLRKDADRQLVKVWRR